MSQESTNPDLVELTRRAFEAPNRRDLDAVSHFRQREGWVFLWERGLIARLSTQDIDVGRAAAERLAESRA